MLNDDVCERSNKQFYFDFSACTSFFTLNYFKSAINPNTTTGELSNGGLINFGQFENASYNTWQLVVFAGIFQFLRYFLHLGLLLIDKWKTPISYICCLIK